MDWRNKILDLEVDGGLAVIGILLAGEGLVGGDGHERHLVALELLKGLEDDAGDGMVPTGSGEDGPAPSPPIRKLQVGAERGVSRRQRGIGGRGGEKGEPGRGLEKHGWS